MIRGKNDVVWPKPQDDAVKYLSIMFSAPEALCEMLVKAYGEHDAMEILRYRPKDRTVTVRVNYLRCDDARLRRSSSLMTSWISSRARWKAFIKCMARAI